MNDLKQIFRSRALLEIFLCAVLSGMPFAILASSISAWLADLNIAVEVITTIAIARIPYALKVFWAPVVDHFKVPFFGIFGHRKSWMILCASVIGLCMLCISKIDNPQNEMRQVITIALCIGFFAATFDISYDALRIEKMIPETQSVGAATAVLGYRIGMWINSAGTLYVAHLTSNWAFTMQCFAAIFIIAALLITFVKETKGYGGNKNHINDNSVTESKSIEFKYSVKFIITPLFDFFQKKGSVLIVLVMVFYKLSDAMLGNVSNKFYRELGFSLGEIALAVKTYGFIATILGSYAGGVIIYRLGYSRGLMYGCIAQSITNLTYVWLHHNAGDVYVLFSAVCVENFAGGIGSSALVGYLSFLCNKKYAASQYALFSGCVCLFNDTVVVYAGSLVKILGWDMFFMSTVLMAIPAIFFMILLNKVNSNNQI